MEFLDLCRDFIGLDSSPSAGNSVLARRAADLCNSIGLEVNFYEESLREIEQALVIGRRQGEKADADFLVLQAHLDTSAPGPHRLWTKTGSNPFQATVYDGQLFGLGASGAKLDFLCKWQALRELNHRKFKKSTALVGTYGEESGMKGSSRLLRRKLLSPKLVLVGSPTDLQVVNAGKGLAILEIEIPFSTEEITYREQHDCMESTTTQSRMFQGLNIHSSDTNQTDNAIVKMLDYMTTLPGGVVVMDMDGGVSPTTIPSYAFFEMDIVGYFEVNLKDKVNSIFAAIRKIEREFSNFVDTSFTPPGPTLNLGMVRTHSEFVVLTGCFRVPPSVGESVYKRWVRQLKFSCEAVGAQLRMVDYKPPFQSVEVSEFKKVCQEAAREVGGAKDFGTLSAATEASVFAAFGAEVLIFGAGRVQGNINGPDESVSLSKLEMAKNFYKYIIERLCL